MLYRAMKTRITILFIALSQVLFSQDIPDASAIYARTGILGTARTIGSAGAYGSVGADMGCIAVNPAGIGLYRSTDFSVTPSLQIGNNESVYDGNHTLVHKPSFYLSQGGFVFTKIYKNADDNNQSRMGFSDHPLKSISVAFNFQQTNTFDRKQNYGVNSTSSSILDGYALYANQINGPASNNNPVGFNSDPPEVALAAYSNLLGYNSTTGSYFSAIKDPVMQSGSIETHGAINRIDFAVGANISDKLYIGVNLAVPLINYTISNSFTETPLNTTPGNQTTNYNFNSNVQESGFGFNGIIGVIYRPFPFMRIGAAYHLPTWYSMTENYSQTLTQDSDVYQSIYGPVTATPLKYGMRTPMKGSFGMSFYYKQYGFISVDYDIQNLGSALVHIPNDSSGYEAYLNPTIKSTYTYSHTVHAGLEAAIKIVRLRAGYSFSSSPFKKGQEITTGYRDVRNAFTAGIGIRLKHFYVDAAYVYGWSKDASNQLTNIANGYYNNVNSMYSSSTILLTIGWKFEAGGKNSNQQKAQQPRYTPPPVDNDPKY